MHGERGALASEELKAFLDEGIRSLGKDALKLVARKPGLLLAIKRMYDGLERAEKRRKASASSGTDVPAFMIASVTKRCNLGCRGCYASVNSSGCVYELAPERWEAIFKEASDLGVAFILIAGGEPLERPDVLRSAASCHEVVFPVFTNGLLIDRNFASFFASNRNMVPVISLEGGRGSTDERRGPGVFDGVMDAMRLLSEKAVLFGTSITVTSENLDEITSDAFISALRAKGVGVFIYVEYVPADGKSEELAPDTEARGKLAARVSELKRVHGGIHICFPGDEEKMGGCLAAGRGFVHANPSGGLEPCPFSPLSDSSLADMSLKDALRSPFLKRLRESGALAMEHLGGCSLWNRKDEVEALLSGK